MIAYMGFGQLCRRGETMALTIPGITKLGAAIVVALSFTALSAAIDSASADSGWRHRSEADRHERFDHREGRFFRERHERHERDERAERHGRREGRWWRERERHQH
jgi:hypothetical protein